MTGATLVTGWAFDDGTVSKVEVLIDGVVDGAPHYGDARPDVAAAYPFSPVNVGFSYSLNTVKYSNGVHKLNVRVTDAAGNVAVLPDVPITFSD